MGSPEAKKYIWTNIWKQKIRSTIFSWVLNWILRSSEWMQLKVCLKKYPLSTVNLVWQNPKSMSNFCNKTKPISTLKNHYTRKHYANCIYWKSGANGHCWLTHRFKISSNVAYTVLENILPWVLKETYQNIGEY